MGYEHQIDIQTLCHPLLRIRRGCTRVGPWDIGPNTSIRGGIGQAIRKRVRIGLDISQRSRTLYIGRDCHGGHGPGNEY